MHKLQYMYEVALLFSLCYTNFQFLDGCAKTTTRRNTVFLFLHLKKVTCCGVWALYHILMIFIIPHWTRRDQDTPVSMMSLTQLVRKQPSQIINKNEVTTLTTFGYLILISIDVRSFVSVFSSAVVSIRKIYQKLKTSVSENCSLLGVDKVYR